MTTTAVTLSPVGNIPTYVDSNGNPLAGGLIYAYVAGSTTTLQTTFSDSVGAVPNPNPIVLDSSGRMNTEMWLSTGQFYHIYVTDSIGSPVWSVDNIVGTGQSVSASTITSETVTATQGQTTVTLTHAYQLGSGALEISLNGAVQVNGIDYVEVTSTSILMATGLNLGDVIYARVFSVNPGTYTSADLVSDTGHTSVQAALDSFRSYETTNDASMQRLINNGRDIRTFAGIVADGVTDDFLALQAAFNTAIAGGYNIYFPTGVYCKVLFTITHPNLFIHGKISILGGDAQNCGFKISKNYDNFPIVHAPLFCWGIASKGATVDAWRGTMQGVGFIINSDCGTFERCNHFYEWSGSTVRDCFFDSRAVTWALAKMAGGFLSSNVQPTWAVGQTPSEGITIENNEAHASAYYQNSEPVGFTLLQNSKIVGNRFYGFSDDIGVHAGNNILVADNYHSTIFGRLYVEDATNVTLRNNTVIRCKDPAGAWPDGSGGTLGCRITMSATYAANTTCVTPYNIHILNNKFIIPNGAYMSTAIYCENVQDGLLIDGNIFDNEGSADVTSGTISIVSTALLGTWTGPAGNPDFATGHVRVRSCIVSNNICTGPGWVDGDGSCGVATALANAIIGPITIRDNVIGAGYIPYDTVYFDASNRCLPVTVDPWMNVSSVAVTNEIFAGNIVAGDQFEATHHPVTTPLTIKNSAGLDFFAPAKGSIRGFRFEVAAAATASNLITARIMKTTGGVRAQLGTDLTFTTVSPSTNCIAYIASYYLAAMTFAKGDKIELLMYNGVGQNVALVGRIHMLGLYV